MPRDANGRYTLPEGNPVLANTTIDPDWANTTLHDIAQALTESYAVDGSVPPEAMIDSPLAFQKKLGIDVILSSGLARLNALEAKNNSEIGTIFPHGRTSGAPAHALYCDGAAVSRTTYAKLFAVIGTTFGAGNGTTTFNLPDMRNRSARGWDNGRGVDSGRALGSFQAGTVLSHDHTASTNTTGAHTHTAATSAGGVHSHSASTNSAGAHTHTASGATGSNRQGHTHTFSGSTSTTANHTHAFDTTSSTSNGGTSAGAGGFGSGGGETSTSTGAHTHTLGGTTSGNNVSHAHLWGANTAAGGVHTHTITVDSGGAHTHSASTVSGGAHTHTLTVNSAGGESRVRSLLARHYIKFE